MENWSVWKTIKIGFLLGIGFIIPQLLVLYTGTVLTILAIPSMLDAQFDELDEFTDSGFAEAALDYDRTDHIEVTQFREQKNGEQLLVLGTIQNTGDKSTNSITLEAELSDKAGEFVYECTEYISKNLEPGESENFQIKCGCGQNPMPEYATMNVRVVSASSF